MFKVTSAVALISFAVTAANAADIPVPAPVTRVPVVAPVIYDFTGCYIGGHAGGHAGYDKVRTTTNPDLLTEDGAASIDAQTPETLQPRGFIGGGQFGCNYHGGGMFILGLEIDGSWMSGRASRSTTVTGPGASIVTNEISNSWLATARVRVGATAGRTMFYVTGGAAFGGLKATDNLVAGPQVNTTGDIRAHRVGWTAGGGIEFAFAHNWTIRGEYLYVALSGFNNAIPCLADCDGNANYTVVNHRYSGHIARVGLNYFLPWNR